MGRRKQAAKLSDVAGMAGVSIATASIILNNPEKNRFSEQTRQKVLETAEKLQYIPASYAQQMKGKDIAVIGLIIPDLMNSYFPEITSGFSRLANKLGYQVMLLDTANNFQREQSFIETLIRMRVAGVGLCGTSGTYEAEEQILIKKMMAMDIPVVQFDRYSTDSVCPYVGIDNFRAAFCMTGKMIQAGHHKLALLMCEDTSFIVKERYRGYMEAMKQYGYQSAVFTYDYEQFGSIYQQFNQIVNSEEHYTAIFTISGDIDAIECIRAADKMGIRVPADLSIAGFDDISMAEVINPALTTIYQPKFEIGETAMRLLATMIDKQKLEEQNVILPFEYVVRESTRVILDEAEHKE